ncbi:hypothetical protein DO97_03515 [Neosynechococcus sphagnicola sy1]|uniref:DUF433 domain-containing protein n=1 Tax=Neosynechococcus sphagnicola sy1 TaxID=1497020 RepID=A0A098TKK3_9CYAN|nr:DUF433 domain-containing protein [Neosynechococcus sphagnicola]KGF72819.1 hypothetical protein DO97_03515 [Neosynechococcus sphagnicola sy1]
MNIEDYFTQLAPDDIRISGTRIGIESILYEYIYRGKTPEEIAQQFHTVTLEQVYATILYYLHNKEAVSAYIADWLEFARRQREQQQQNPSPVRLRLQQIKAEQVAQATTGLTLSP